MSKITITTIAEYKQLLQAYKTHMPILTEAVDDYKLATNNWINAGSTNSTYSIKGPAPPHIEKGTKSSDPLDTSEMDIPSLNVSTTAMFSALQRLYWLHHYCGDRYHQHFHEQSL